MHSKCQWIRTLLGLIFVSSVVVGCQLAPVRKEWPVPDKPWGDLNKHVSPSLEQIFLDPPMTGEAPSIAGISADGLWVLSRWSEPAAEEETAEPEADLRLLSTRAPGTSNGTPINESLGLEDEHARGPWTWSFEGSTLAIARDRRIYLFDPGSGERLVFVEGPAAALEPEAPRLDPEETTDAHDPTQHAGPPEQPELPPFRIQSLAFAPDGLSLRAFINDDLYVFPVDGMQATEAMSLADGRCLSSDFESKMRFSWSADLQVVFGNDPYPLQKQAQATESEEAEDSEPAVSQEQTDTLSKSQIWRVAEKRGVVLEGMHDMRWLESTSLSKDGRYVFGASYDRRAEPSQVHVPNYLSERVSTIRGRRLLAEDGPSYFDLYIWNTSSGERSTVFPEESLRDWDASAPEANHGKRQEGDWWLRIIGWSPQSTEDAPARFAFERQSADYHTLELWVWSEGRCEQVWADYDERWLGGPARYSIWSQDGARLLVGSEWGQKPGTQNEATPAAKPEYVSTTPGKCQLFAVDPADGKALQLTRFAGELTRFYGLPNGGVVVSGSETNAAQRVVGVLSSEAVRGEAEPSPSFANLPAGWNDDVRSSSDGSRLVYSHGELMQPAELWFSEADKSHPITAATPKSFGAVDWIKPERMAVASKDGKTIWAHVYLPRGVTLENPGAGPRAAIVFVHGAGYLQNVTDSMTRYEPNMLFHSRLAELGYPVIDVDYRGSSGYGSHFRSDVQYHLGGLDLDDIHQVLDALIESGHVDSERVGLYGGSYGGFLTMMALFTAPERWAAGAALRSVTDWRTYHPTYTQPRLGRPSTHAEAYAKSSPIDLYEKLEDPLLILHGMQDDNVFAQDSIRLMEALIDQGSDFEAMLYPSQRHGFTDGQHWLDEYRRIERFLLRHLGPALRAD